MSRLVIFGDSFSSTNTFLTEDMDTWVNLLQQKLQLPVVNNSVAGSSLNYSITAYNKFLNTDCTNEDIIVFIATNGLRCPVVHPDYPPEYSALINVFSNLVSGDKNTGNLPQKVLDHFNEHINFYEMIIRYYNEDLHVAHVNMLRDSMNNLPNKKY